MRRVRGRFLVLLAAVLISVSIAAPLPGGEVTYARGDAPRTQLPDTAAAGWGLGSSPAPVPTPTPPPTATPTTKELAAALEKLRARPAASAARSRHAAVELPRRLVIPALGVDAGFEFVGLAADGAMDVPRDGLQVAWYQLGPRPGEPGNAVVAGHVDWGGKTAVFWKLRDLKPGDGIEVVAADERNYSFVVQSARWYEADRAPVEEIFGQSDATEITLITCGGDFDRSLRQYRSRLVVKATLK